MGRLKDSRRNMVALAWTQLVLSIVCIPLFVAPFSTAVKVTVLGVVSALTWTGTALGNLAAAWAARDVKDEET